jgi:hypothetical protein
LSQVTAVAAGFYHSLAVTSDGTVWGWGDNRYNQGGDGTTTQHNTPVPVPGLNGVTMIATGGYHSLALVVSNRPPVANTDSYDVLEDDALMVAAPGVVGNDTDADGNPLSTALVSGPAHGTLALNADGSFTYTPFPGYHGLDSFVYKANDGQADSDVASVNITVSEVNDAPAIAAIGDRAVDEGTLLTFVTAGSDVDGDPLIHSAANLPEGATFDASTRTFSWTPGFAQAGTYKGVRLQVSDGSLSAFEDITITVNDVNRAPSIVTITGPTAPVRIGTRVQATATFADPDGDDTHTAVFDWGDGVVNAGSVDEHMGSGTSTGNHEYAQAGLYRVSVRLTDRSGASAEGIHELVIYDPDSGFVTGAGWISSPAGSWAVNPAIAGKASFAFVSSYAKGATVPTGQTRFQFSAADLSFASTTYEWLALGGATALFKAVGTIKGAGDYGLLLIAVDGDHDGGAGADKVRIKIWERATGSVVYDNRMGAGETAEDTMELSAGSIVVHK